MEIVKGSMLKENEDLRGALVNYLDLMNKQEYFDAHEVLEEAWHPMRKNKDPLQNLVKGLINAAVAFEHLKRAKPGAEQRARRVIASFERHSVLCESDIREADLFLRACQKVERIKERHREVFDVLVS